MDGTFKYEIDGRPLRVLFVSADSSGCGFYRAFMPSFHMDDKNYADSDGRGFYRAVLPSIYVVNGDNDLVVDLNKRFSYWSFMPVFRVHGKRIAESRISGKAAAVPFEHIDWADVIFFQRIAEVLNAGWAYATLKGKRIIVENDDLYSKVPMQSHAKKFFPPDVLRGINQTLRLADAITVTTQTLADEYGKLNSNVSIIPNSVPLDVVNDYPQFNLFNNDKFIIGYHGSATHVPDFAPVTDALIDILDKYPYVRLHALGFIPDAIRREFPARCYLHPWVTLHKFYNAIKSLGAHVALAPIADIPFNHAKSNLKCLEYGLINTPWIASNVEPYQKITRESGAGVLVKHRYKDWYNALDYFINMSQSDRQRMANAGRQYVEKHYNIKTIADKWARVAYDVATAPPNAKREAFFIKNRIKVDGESFEFKQIV